VQWALALTLLLAFFFMPRLSSLNLHVVVPAAVYCLLPVFVVAIALAYGLKSSRRLTRSLALPVGGGAVGLLLTNLCLLTGVCNLWLLAFSMVVAGELVRCQMVDDTGTDEQANLEAGFTT